MLQQRGMFWYQQTGNIEVARQKMQEYAKNKGFKKLTENLMEMQKLGVELSDEMGGAKKGQRNIDLAENMTKAVVELEKLVVQGEKATQSWDMLLTYTSFVPWNIAKAVTGLGS